MTLSLIPVTLIRLSSTKEDNTGWRIDWWHKIKADCRLYIIIVNIIVNIYKSHTFVLRVILQYCSHDWRTLPALLSWSSVPVLVNVSVWKTLRLRKRPLWVPTQIEVCQLMILDLNWNTLTSEETVLGFRDHMICSRQCSFKFIVNSDQIYRSVACHTCDVMWTHPVFIQESWWSRHFVTTQSWHSYLSHFFPSWVSSVMGLQEFWKSYKVLIVMGPSLGLIHWGWYTIQKNPLLHKSKEESIPEPWIVAYVSPPATTPPAPAKSK